MFNLNQSILKVNNYMGLSHYDESFINAINKFFDGYDDMTKTSSINNILRHIGMSTNKVAEEEKFMRMFSEKNKEKVNGFFSAIGVPVKESLICD